MSVLEDTLEKASELCDAIVKPGPDKRPITKLALELNEYLVAAEVETEEVYGKNWRQSQLLTNHDSTLRCIQAVLDSEKFSDETDRLNAIREFLKTYKSQADEVV